MVVWIFAGGGEADIWGLVNLEIYNLNWPIGLSQSPIVMTALAKLPNNQACQKVFDIVAKGVDNCALKKRILFLLMHKKSPCIVMMRGL